MSIDLVDKTANMPLDTVKIATTLECFKELKMQNWAHKEGGITPKHLDLFGGNHVRSSHFSIDQNLRQFNKEVEATGAKVDILNDKVILEFSAKTLGKNYLEGLSENTIEQALDNINKISKWYFTLDKQKVLGAAIEQVHNTVNIPINANEIVPIIDSFKALVDWKFKKQDTRYLTTATFWNKSEEMEIYSKLHEMQDNSQVFLKLVGDPQDMLRLEHKLKRKDKTVNVYGSQFYKELNMGMFRNTKNKIIPDIPFSFALKNRVSFSLIRKRYSTMTIREQDKELFSSNEMYYLIQQKSKLELANMFGGLGVFQRLNGNWNALELALKEKHKDHSRQARHTEMKWYRDQVALGQRTDKDLLGMSGKDCKELLQRFNKKLQQVLRTA